VSAFTLMRTSSAKGGVLPLLRLERSHGRRGDIDAEIGGVRGAERAVVGGVEVLKERIPRRDRRVHRSGETVQQIAEIGIAECWTGVVRFFVAWAAVIPAEGAF
jgi:hypothetical protein